MSNPSADRDPIREEFEPTGFEIEVIEAFVAELPAEDQTQYRRLLLEEARAGDATPPATRALERLFAWADARGQRARRDA